MMTPKNTPLFFTRSAIVHHNREYAFNYVTIAPWTAPPLCQSANQTANNQSPLADAEYRSGS